MTTQTRRTRGPIAVLVFSLAILAFDVTVFVLAYRPGDVVFVALTVAAIATAAACVAVSAVRTVVCYRRDPR